MDRAAAEFGGKPGDGMAWLDGVSFASVEIECDILGRLTPEQGGFIGIAFGDQNDETYDAIYFRPFDFRFKNPARRAHAVQHASHPDWTCSRLRQERPGQYEQAVGPALKTVTAVSVRASSSSCRRSASSSTTPGVRA